MGDGRGESMIGRSHRLSFIAIALRPSRASIPEAFTDRWIADGIDRP
jgi:hypothetical protein